MEPILNKEFYLLYTLKQKKYHYIYEFKSDNTVIFTLKSSTPLVRGDIVKIVSLDLSAREMQIEKSDSVDSKNVLMFMLSRLKFHKKFSTLDYTTKLDTNILILDYVSFPSKSYKKIFCLALDSNDYNNYYIRLDNQFNFELSFLKGGN